MSKVPSKRSLAPTKPDRPSGKSENCSPVRASSKPSSRKPSVSKTTTRIESSSSKTSIVDKSMRTDASLTQRLTPKLLIDNLLCGLISETSLDFSNLQQSEIPHAMEMMQKNVYEYKGGDELTSLREELRAKNAVIEQLKKENVGLRKEIGEFLAIADKIQTHLDDERRSYERRIASLEQENKDLLAENRFYRDQTHRRFKHRSSMDQITFTDAVLGELNDQTQNFNEEKQDEAKGFYSTKDDLKRSMQTLQVEKYSIKENTPNTCRNLRESEKTPSRLANTKREKSKLMSTPNTKSRSGLHSTKNSVSGMSRGINDMEGKVSFENMSDRKGNSHVSWKLKV